MGSSSPSLDPRELLSQLKSLDAASIVDRTLRRELFHALRKTSIDLEGPQDTFNRIGGLCMFVPIPFTTKKPTNLEGD